MFKPVTARGVKLEILALPNNKSHGLYSCQTKLLKYSSTIISDILAKIVNAIVDFVSAIQSNMDKRLFTCGIFIDLTKAFDTVTLTIKFF